MVLRLLVCLVCARHCDKLFTCIRSLNPHTPQACAIFIITPCDG